MKSGIKKKKIHTKREWGFLSLKTRKKADFSDRRRLILQRVLEGDWEKAPDVVVLRCSAPPPLTPYLPSPPYSLCMRYDLPWSEFIQSSWWLSPMWVSPLLSSGPQTRGWRISYWGRGRCEAKMSQAQLTFPPGTTHFTHFHPLLSLCSQSFLCLGVLLSPFCLQKL